VKNKYRKRSRISERKFRQVLSYFSADLPALTAAKLAGLNYRTVHGIYTLLRARVVALALQEARPMLGQIEVDESYFGARRVRGKRGRGAAGKTPVIGLHKRGQCVYLSVVRNCSRRSLLPVVKGRVLKGSDIYTDGWGAYDGLVTQGYKHHRIHHHQNEFARGRNHVNGIESFWSYAKFRFTKLRGVRKQKFLLHLKKCEWRFNHRHDHIHKIILKSLRENPLSTT
jgi:transposase-like protein